MSRGSSKRRGGRASSSRSRMVVGPFDSSVTWDGALQQVIAQCLRPQNLAGVSTSTVLPLIIELVPPARWQVSVVLPKGSASDGAVDSGTRFTLTSAGKSALHKREERRV